MSTAAIAKTGPRVQRNPKALIIGPTPPPYHGNAVYTELILRSDLLRRAYALIHLETADRRDLENMGRLDIRNVALALRHLAQLARLLIGERPDVVYIPVAQNALAAFRDVCLMALCRIAGVPIATHLHGSEYREFYQRSGSLMRALIRFSSRWVAAAGVLGENLRGIYAGLVPEERVVVAPNGIADPFAAAPAARLPDGRVQITYLGALYRPKGILDLLEAAALVECGSDLRFVFAGAWVSDDDRTAAEDAIRRLQLEQRVEFVGVVAGAAKLDLLRTSDVLVFPGVQPEGLPLVILEAMAAQLPVVSTDRGAIADAIRDGETGLLVPAGNPAAIAAALDRLARDPELRARLGKRGRARFLERFTDTRAVEHLVRLLDCARNGERVAHPVENR